MYARGTSSYRAPELIRDDRYTNKVDIWAFGCILFEVVFKEKVFAGDFAVLQYASSPVLKLKSDVSDILTQTIHDTLAVDPAKRPRAEQLHKRFTSGVLGSTLQVPESQYVPPKVPEWDSPPTSHIHLHERGGLMGRQLVHYWRDDTRPKLRLTWNRGDIISSKATSSASIAGTPNLYDTLVLEGSELVHYYCYQVDFEFDWRRGEIISDRATGPAGFARGTPTVRDVVILEDKNLVHFKRVGGTWRKAGLISSHATGPGSLVATSINLDVIIPEGYRLVLYSFDNDLWIRRQVVAMASENGPDTFLQSTFIGKLNIRNYELVVFNDGHLVHKWRDNSAPDNPWDTTAVITTSAMSSGVFLQTIGLGASPGYLEVLVIEEPGDLVYYWRDHTKDGQPWYKGPTISTEAVV